MSARSTVAFLIIVALIVVSLPASVIAATAPSGEWDVVSSANAGAGDNQFADVSTLSGTDAWAVGYARKQGYATPLAEHWDGTRWVVVPTPNPGGTQWTTLDGVAAVTSTDVWAVGAIGIGGGTPLIEHWDGVHWESASLPTDSSTLFKVAAVSSSDVWAVGAVGSNEGTRLMHWNGLAWSIVTSPDSSTSAALTDVVAVAADNVWAVGWKDGGASSLIEHWNGTNWSVVPSPDPFSTQNALAAVSFIAADDAWAVGTGSDGGVGKSFIEHWDGSSWTTSASPSFAKFNTLNGVAGVSSGDVWAVGSIGESFYQRTLIEHWNGSSWTTVSGPNPQPYQDGLAAVTTIPSSTDVIAVGSGDTKASISRTVVERWYTYLKAVPVLTTKADEFLPSGSSSYLSWSANSPAHPKHSDTYAEEVGHQPFKVNAKGTYGYGGGIDGNRLLYQQVNASRTQSDLQFFNLATHRRSRPPGGLDSKLWEFDPTLSGSWVLYGRIDFRKASSPWRIELFNLTTHATRILDTVTAKCGCEWPGQVSGHYATWTKCTGACHVYLYDISSGKSHVLPQPRGTDQYAGAVSASGTVYVARAGQKCGAHVRIIAQPRGGSAYPVRPLPSGVDMSVERMYVYTDGSSVTHLLYAAGGCSSKQYNVFAIDGA